jgi:dethiobiotin synthetase
MPALFVTATGTDIGKTFVAAALIRALMAEGREVDAFKPVLSGYDRYEGSDAARLLEALGRDQSRIDWMSPLRYQAPLAPSSAARLEGDRLELDQLADLCAGRIQQTDWRLLLIEGAGGVMSPIAEGATNLDLMIRLGVPVLLVTGSYLGSVSHTLTALAVLEHAELTVSAIVISESEGAPPVSEMTDALAEFAPVYPVVVAPRDPMWTAEALAALV